MNDELGADADKHLEAELAAASALSALAMSTNMRHAAAVANAALHATADIKRDRRTR